MTDDSMKAKRTSKPKLENKRGSLTIRLRDEVRSELEQSAAKHGRSLSEEMETRMEISLAAKHQFQYQWGKDFFRIAEAGAVALANIEDWTGKSWTSDERTAKLFKLVLSQIVQNYLDRQSKKTRSVKLGDFDKMSPEELVDAFAAISGLAPPRPRRAPVELVVSDD